MKSYATFLLYVGAVLSILTPSAAAQGTVHFNNLIRGVLIDAPVSFLDGSLVGAGFQAQLYGGPEGSSVDQLTPLEPTTNFPRAVGNRPGYINPVIVSVPGTTVNDEVTMVMRAYNGSSWELSSCRGESLPIVVKLGGSLPTYLEGLQPFSVDCIPEPGPLALFALAAGATFLFWRGRRPT